MIYHNYIFFAVDNTIRDLNLSRLKKLKKEFSNEISKSTDVVIYSYSLLGLKSQIVFMLWFQSDSIEQIQNLLNKLKHTKVGKYISITHTLFGVSHKTQYSADSGTKIETTRKGGKYLIIYPFTKTTEWHMLDFKTRKTLMAGHIAIGRKYPQITQLLLYSYGVDDSEFIVSYECDNLSDFQRLVMDLRADKVRAYTKSDIPIYTCIYKTFEEVLEFL